jgi:putative FmdB family regulatory protein
MAIYEYICEKCEKRFFHLMSMLDIEREAVCPRCRSKKVKRTISATTFPEGSWAKHAVH